MTDESFPLLIHRLVVEHHQGNLLSMTRRSGIDHGTLRNWVHGLTKQPDLWLVRRLCEVYGLDMDEALHLMNRDVVRRALAQPVPLPDLSRVRRGPAPGTARGRTGRGPGKPLAPVKSPERTEPRSGTSRIA
jgi:hypothetical protein